MLEQLGTGLKRFLEMLFQVHGSDVINLRGPRSGSEKLCATVRFGSVQSPVPNQINPVLTALPYFF
jgi:hypothetical protein